MISCIFVFYIAASGGPADAITRVPQSLFCQILWSWRKAPCCADLTLAWKSAPSASAATGAGSPTQRRSHAAGAFYPLRVTPAHGWLRMALSADRSAESDTMVSKPEATQTAAADADALYAQRENLASARKAAAIWAGRLQANPQDFEAAWKLARARYWLGGHAAEDERKELLEAGITAARAAIAVEPQRPEGHFWMAANMGDLAESHGLRQGLKYRGDIKKALLTVLKLDPAFQQGSADRALGRWYYKVPGLFGGSNEKAEEHLRRSLKYNPVSTASLYFLAEALIEEGREDEARAQLQKVLDAPLDPDWTPEDREFKAKASRLLATLR
jgi:tetratricopeptide (TPR) repeat protein